MKTNTEVDTRILINDLVREVVALPEDKRGGRLIEVQYSQPELIYKKVLKLVEELSSSEGLQFTNAASLKNQAPVWLWKDRIPAALTLLAGEPGAGKSTCALSFCSIVTNGGTWPDGTPCETGRVLIIQSEDNRQQTVMPRLEAAGAHMERIDFLDFDSSIDHEGRRTIRSFRINEHALKLSKQLAMYKDTAFPVRMIYIDPITEFIGSDVNGNDTCSVKDALSPLLTIAEQFNVAIVGIIHLNKKEGLSAGARISGSGAWLATARQVNLFGKNPQNEGMCVMAPVKHNLTPVTSAVEYQIKPVSVAIQDDTGELVDYEFPAAHWTVGTLDMSADEMLAKPDTSKVQEAIEFLEHYLSGGKEPGHAVKKAGNKEGHSTRTLQRACERLNIVIDKPEAGSTVWWSLPVNEKA